jgi:hemerythrin-like domain-containing protein
MFFPSKTVSALTADHKRLRTEMKILRNIENTMRERKNAFERLVPNLYSHSHREENVIYNYLKTLSEKLPQALAFKGIEEHLIVDQLLTEMNATMNSPGRWSAQAVVLCDLIESHVNEEEASVFHLLKKHLNSTTDAELCRKYESNVITRKQANDASEESFDKKINPPAPFLKPIDPHPLTL